MINWGSFVLVAVVSIGSAAAIVALFAFGLRLQAIDSPRALVRAASYGCFGLAAAGALFGVYLIVPALHGA